MSQNASTNPRDGFTLVELLVALALTGVIGAAMAMTITQLRPMQAFEERIDEQQIAATLADVIARDLQGALLLPLSEDGGGTNLLMRGTENKVSFTAVVPVGYLRNGLREVTYEVENVEGGSRLLRTTRLRRFSQLEAEEGGQRDELYVGRLVFGFSYLDLEAQGKQIWQQEFVEPSRLPLAVKVVLSHQSCHKLRKEASMPRACLTRIKALK